MTAALRLLAVLTAVWSLDGGAARGQQQPSFTLTAGQPYYFDNSGGFASFLTATIDGDVWVQRVNPTTGQVNNTLLTTYGEQTRPTIVVPNTAAPAYTPNPNLPTVLYTLNSGSMQLPTGTSYTPDFGDSGADYLGFQSGGVNCWVPAAYGPGSVLATAPATPAPPNIVPQPNPESSGIFFDPATGMFVIRGPNVIGAVIVPGTVIPVTLFPQDAPPPVPNTGGMTPGQSKNVNGGVLTLNADGSITFKKDGITTIWNPNGTVITQTADGSAAFTWTPNGAGGFTKTGGVRPLPKQKVAPPRQEQ